MDSKIKNLLKNPAKGGIPAIENNNKTKLTVKIRFFDTIEVKFKKYRGWKVEAVLVLIRSDKVVNVRLE